MRIQNYWVSRAASSIYTTQDSHQVVSQLWYSWRLRTTRAWKDAARGWSSIQHHFLNSPRPDRKTNKEGSDIEENLEQKILTPENRNKYDGGEKWTSLSEKISPCKLIMCGKPDHSSIRLWREAPLILGGKFYETFWTSAQRDASIFPRCLEAHHRRFF